MADKILLYGSPSCGMVPPVRGVLERAGAAYEYIDISQDPQARQRVRDINQGNASVPTLEFPDGSTLTEPSLGELRAALRALGYQAGRPARAEQAKRILANPFVRLLGLALLLVGLVAGNNWPIAIGVAILIVGLLSVWRWGSR